MSKNVYLTQEQYDNHIKERDNIKNIKLKEKAEQIADAAAQGDLSENAEYENAKEEQAHLMKSLSQIEEKIKYAKIIKKSDQNDIVEIGHTIKIYNEAINKEENITLMGFGDGIETISIDSELGKGLLGCKVGDKFTVDAKLKPYQCQVLSID